MSSYYEKFLATGEVKCIDEEIPFEVPNGWAWCRLNNLADIVRGGSPRPAGSPEYYNGNIPFLKVADLTKDSCMYVSSYTATIKEAGLKKTRKVSANTLLLTNSGATLGVPKVCTFETTFNDGIAAFLYLSEELKQYLYWFLCAMTDIYRNINQGTAQPNLNTDIIKDTLFAIPPIGEQRRIIKRIEELYPIIEKYSLAQSKLSQLNADIYANVKKSILYEAIQGRLVPQDSNDEPASILLQRIREEKLRLVKEGKLKKKDVIDSTIFRGDDNKYYEQIGSDIYDITDNIPFDIPVNWNWCRLKDVVSIFTGATFKKEDASTGSKGVRVLRGGNISPFELVMKPDDLFLPCTKIKESILLRKNDIVTPAVTSLENIGKAARVKKDLNDVTVGGFVFILRSFLCNDWLSQYLLALLGSPSMGEYMKSVTNKSGQAFYNIGKERLAMAMIPLPPIKEQQRIVAQIEKLFEQLK